MLFKICEENFNIKLSAHQHFELQEYLVLQMHFIIQRSNITLTQCSTRHQECIKLSTSISHNTLRNTKFMQRSKLTLYRHTWAI